MAIGFRAVSGIAWHRSDGGVSSPDPVRQRRGIHRCPCVDFRRHQRGRHTIRRAIIPDRKLAIWSPRRNGCSSQHFAGRAGRSRIRVAFSPATATILACGSSEQQVTGSDVVPEPTGTPVPVPVGEGSEATFTVNEKLSRLPLPNDAVLRTGEISDEIDLSKGTASLVINLHALKSDQSRRDSYVRDRMFPRQPEATISITAFPEIPASFADGETFTSSVIGNVN